MNPSAIHQIPAPEMRGVAITITSLEKNFGATAVLKGVDLEIAPGEFVVLLGPSGCGKSTLLRMISGLDRQSSGDISIGDRVVNDLLPKERDIAMVFQSYALYPHMSVEQNMTFGLRLARMAKDQIGQRLRQAGDILGLGQLLARYPRELSGGQRQRVSMGRAIVRSPSVFLFDEPLSNLDAQLRVHMRGEIRDLHDRLGTTSIYVTHDQIEAMTMADRIVVMCDGSIEQIGRPLDVFDRPATRFVAGFIGSPAMNFLPARITDGDSGHCVAQLSGGQMLRLPDIENALRGKSVVIGIRPHEIALTGADPLEARVHLVQQTGIETLALCRIGEEELLVQTPDRVSLAKGERIELSPKSSKLHIFDRDTGERLN